MMNSSRFQSLLCIILKTLIRLLRTGATLLASSSPPLTSLKSNTSWTGWSLSLLYLSVSSVSFWLLNSVWSCHPHWLYGSTPSNATHPEWAGCRCHHRSCLCRCCHPRQSSSSLIKSWPQFCFSGLPSPAQPHQQQHPHLVKLPPTHLSENLISCLQRLFSPSPPPPSTPHGTRTMSCSNLLWTNSTFEWRCCFGQYVSWNYKPLACEAKNCWGS